MIKVKNFLAIALATLVFCASARAEEPVPAIPEDVRVFLARVTLCSGWMGGIDVAVKNNQEEFEAIPEPVMRWAGENCSYEEIEQEALALSQRYARDPLVLFALEHLPPYKD